MLRMRRVSLIACIALMSAAPWAKSESLPPTAVTEHEIQLEGKKLRYRATAGFLPQKNDEDGKVKANIFFTAYTVLGKQSAAQRPILFAWNGGPGSASIWLHMGALGPRRVLLTDDGHTLPPPGKTVDNEASWLDVADLVFIDPVSTGFSRPAPGEDKGQFHGYQEDIASVGEFIRLYLTRYERWASPKFMAGESYGGARASGLSQYLQDRGIYFNGIVLVSPAFDYQVMTPTAGNEIAHAWALPSMTAAAWYHRRLQGEWAKTLSSAVQEAERFALEEYAPALIRGDALPAAEMERLASRLAEFTGLPVDYVRQSQLRPMHVYFADRLLHDQNRTLGMFDARVLGIRLMTEYGGSDPSYDALRGAFTAGFLDYVRGTLKFSGELPYDVRGNLGLWKEPQGAFLNASETLRQAMTRNEHLKVWVVSGYYDLVVPYFGNEKVIHALSLDPAIRGNITHTVYEGGHMLYTVRSELLKLKRDFREWAEGALPR